MSIGLDKYIDDAISVFTSDLWVGFNNSFLGRSERLENDGLTQPCIYNKDNRYNEVFATRNFDSLVHFDIEPSNELIGSSQGNIDVNILFAVNLSKIYGNDSRYKEQAKADIVNALKYTSFDMSGGYVDQLPAYTDIYDLTTDQEHKFNMQPFYVIRFKTTVMASLGNCEPSTPVVNYKLDVSHVGEGVTNPDTGIYPREAGTTERITATEEEGDEFVKWTLNGVESFNRILDLVYNGAKTAVATFQTLLTYIKVIKSENVITKLITHFQEIFEQPIIQIEDSNYFKDGSGCDADALITHTQIATFNEDGYLDIPISNNVDELDIELIIKSGQVAEGNIYSEGNSGTSAPLFLIRHLAGSDKLNIVARGDNSVIYINETSSIPVFDGNRNEVLVHLSGGQLQVTINNVLDINTLHTPSAMTRNRAAIGAAALTSYSSFYGGEMEYFKRTDLVDSNNDIELYFQDSAEDKARDSSGNGNDATLVVPSIPLFWSAFSNFAKSGLMQNGYTLFKQIADPTIFVRAIYDVLGNPTETTLTGYTDEGEVVENGFSNTGNKIRQPQEATLLWIGGQSNVDGNFSPSLLPTELQGEQDNIFEFNGTTYDPYNPNLKTYASFIPYLLPQLRDLHGLPIYMAQTYLRGSQLEPGGVPNKSYPTQSFLDDNKAAIDKLRTLGYTKIRVHVIWVQGGTDGADDPPASLYADNLRDLFLRLRGLLNVDLKIHYNLLHVNGAWTYTNTIRAKQLEVSADSVDNVLYNFDSFGFDGSHYTQQGYSDIADLFYNTLKNEVGQGKEVDLKNVSDFHGLGWYDVDGNSIEQSFEDIDSINN